MLRSRDHLLENKIEALEHRRDDLQKQIATLEARLATEKKRYDVEVDLRRQEALLGARPAPDAKELSRVRRLRREAFGQGYVVGLVISLLLGLLSLAGR